MRMHSWLTCALAAMLAIALNSLCVDLAFAQAATSTIKDGATVIPNDPIVVPWGLWVQSLIDGGQEFLVLVITALVAWGMRNMFPAAYKFLMMFVSEQAIKRAVEQAIARARGAVAGKTATVDVSNVVLKEAGEFLVHDVSKFLLRFIGNNWPTVRNKILARMVEQGIVPANYDAKQADKVKAPTDFENAIASGFGKVKLFDVALICATIGFGIAWAVV
jgi:hypothetical protein